MSPSMTLRFPWLDTHPFLNFDFNATELGPESWILLGECSSKIQHVCGVPLEPDTSARLYSIYLAKGAHATTAIEGNTLSEEDVQKMLDSNLTLPKSQSYLGQEVENVVQAYNYLIAKIVEGEPAAVTPDHLKLMNFMTLATLPDLGEGIEPGVYRPHRVTVGDYLAPSAEYNEDLIQRLCTWMNSPEWNNVVGSEFVVTILKAIVAHLYLAWIHPFGDGNGRTARLLEFDMLTRSGVPPASAHLLSDHYNRTRAAYYRALSRARQDAKHFIRYAIQGFADGLREQLKVIREQQMNVAYTHFVVSHFEKLPDSLATRRRRDICLALAFEPEPVPFHRISQLTEKLSRHYARRTPRTLVRDLHSLYGAQFVRIDGGMISANWNRVLAFLPVVHKTATNSKPVPAGRASS